MGDHAASNLLLRDPVHRHNYRVIYGDTDAAGVVYYSNYLRLFEIGRTEYMRHCFGLSYRELEEKGILLPVIEAYCRYKASARYDDLLEIATSLVEYTRVSVRFHYEIRNSEDQKLLAKGSTVHASVDGRTGRLVKLPRELATAIDKVCAI